MDQLAIAITYNRRRADMNSENAVPFSPNFEQTLRRHGASPLTRAATAVLQVNLGKVCNQACHHCHVDAGPARTERMELRTARRVLELLMHSPGISTVDITGGAP